MRKLNESFSNLQAEVSVTKQVNTLLSSRLVRTERQCWLNAQYSRREWLDIVGIPSEVEINALEEKVVVIFEKLGCISQMNSLKLVKGSVKRTPQSLSSFHEERTGSRFGMSRETCKKLRWRILTCLVKTSYSSIKSYARITRWYGQKARNYTV